MNLFFLIEKMGYDKFVVIIIDFLPALNDTRWKIENETFNTLKNQGYHAEHNFGHGNQYLAYNFFL